MNRGQIVEMTDSEKLYKNPIHPYTQSLLSAIPIPDPQNREKQVVRDPLQQRDTRI